MTSLEEPVVETRTRNRAVLARERARLAHAALARDQDHVLVLLTRNPHQVLQLGPASVLPVENRAGHAV